MFSSISDLTWRKVGSDEQQTASHHLGWTAPPRRYFSLIIQTSVTPFLVFIPVSLIFFLFINFFHFPNSRDSVSHIKNPWLRHTFSYWLLPPPQWQRHHAEFLSRVHWQLIDNWLAGTVFSLINYCCFVLIHSTLRYTPEYTILWQFLTEIRLRSEWRTPRQERDMEVLTAVVIGEVFSGPTCKGLQI